jgi:hypothetical protein
MRCCGRCPESLQSLQSPRRSAPLLCRTMNFFRSDRRPSLRLPRPPRHRPRQCLGRSLRPAARPSGTWLAQLKPTFGWIAVTNRPRTSGSQEASQSPAALWPGRYGRAPDDSEHVDGEEHSVTRSLGLTPAVTQVTMERWSGTQKLQGLCE